MNYLEFSNKIQKQIHMLNIMLADQQTQQLYEYMNMMLAWNEKINLTAITEPEEIIQKHFIDSLTILKHIKNEDNVIDIGTGAGFPGVPLKIANSFINITLLDSLNKRIVFLDNVIKGLQLNNIHTMHSRVEDIGRNNKYRESFDVAASRAVASLNILLEYMLPVVKVGGKCICMKGSNIEEELKNSAKALDILGGKTDLIEELELPNSNIKRKIIIVKKYKTTPSKFPRKAGLITKEPII